MPQIRFLDTGAAVGEVERFPGRGVGEGERGYTIGARLEEEGSAAAAAREGRDEGGDVEMMVGMEEEDDGGIGSLVMDSEVSSGGVSLDISRQLSAVQLISSSESGDISRGRDRERGGGYGASIPRGDLP
mmetsp:Transcript_20471/g.33190  ORF Transcript_20471/g.33190 Transcript_20471/m.33190 type:complete len:130 (-) Transcript_20471:48-437(-)